MHTINDLLALMCRLRDPEKGCPWDLEQNFDTIAPHTLEEASEVVDAIANKDYDNLKEELGDLLFQVVFYAEMARQEKLFRFEDIVDVLVEKMVRRHPHIYPDGTLASGSDSAESRISAEKVLDNWQAIKQQEKASQGINPHNSALPDNIPSGLPSILKALALQKAAAKTGFDWDQYLPVIEKIKEELQETIDSAESGEPHERVEEEIGDLLFSCVNLARKLKVNPDLAMRRSNEKFQRRFQTMEATSAHEGKMFKQLTSLEMENLWEKSKK